MKIRSRPLYNFLLEAGALNGTPEQIAYAKQAYRRQYKRNWKQQNWPRKELRIEVTLKQFAAIKVKAHEHEMSHTAYARSAILAVADAGQFMPGRDHLLKILQLVSMTAIMAAKDTMWTREAHELLSEAETMLVRYLKAG